MAEDWPEPDRLRSCMADLVETSPRDRLITRVGQLAELAELSVRSLQRTFAEYVGAGPEVGDPALPAARCGGPGRRPDETIDWADLAIELGFADQAHLTRAFTATVGVPPATCRHARRLAAPRETPDPPDNTRRRVG